MARPSAFEPPVRCPTPPSDSICEPYSAVVTWPIASPSARTMARLGAEVAVGVDLHLDAAVAEDRLGDDGDDVGALDLAADDEGRGLVVGIGGAGADAGDEAVRAAISPSQAPAAKGTTAPPASQGAVEHASAGRSARCGRRRWRSGRRRRSGPGRCSTSPGRRRSGFSRGRSSGERPVHRRTRAGRSASRGRRSAGARQARWRLTRENIERPVGRSLSPALQGPWTAR